MDSTFRVLGGSSLGGLFALSAMVEAPDLFQGIMAPSPAVEVASSWLQAREAKLAKTHSKMDVRVFHSVGGDEPAGFREASRLFRDTLVAHAYQGMSIQWRVLEGERHAGSKAEGFNRALRYVLAPRAPFPSEK